MADGCSSAFHIAFTTVADTTRPVTSTAIQTTSIPIVSTLNHNLDSIGVVYFTGIIEEVVIYHHYSGDVVVGVAIVEEPGFGGFFAGPRVQIIPCTPRSPTCHFNSGIWPLPKDGQAVQLLRKGAKLLELVLEPLVNRYLHLIATYKGAWVFHQALYAGLITHS